MSMLERCDDDRKQPERYALYKLYELDEIARSGYATYNFPKGACILFLTRVVADHGSTVVTALSNFANITLSSFLKDVR